MPASSKLRTFRRASVSESDPGYSPASSNLRLIQYVLRSGRSHSESSFIRSIPERKIALAGGPNYSNLNVRPARVERGNRVYRRRSRLVFGVLRLLDSAGESRLRPQAREEAIVPSRVYAG